MEEIMIDEAQTFSLMKYASAKGKKKLVKSDHNVMFVSFNCIAGQDGQKKGKGRLDLG